MSKSLIPEQYFTTNKYLQEAIYSLILNNPDCVLEPCVGRGDLVQYLQSKMDCKIECFELDNTIEKFVIPETCITFTDFLTYSHKKYYPTIVGNPSYNKAIPFIERCFNLLQDRGELIFIVPFSFFNDSYSKTILQKLYKKGRITHFLYPRNRNLFPEIEIDPIVFRYFKQKDWSNEIWYNGYKRYAYLINGGLQITSSPLYTSKVPKISSMFDFYEGCECGYNTIFNHPILGNVYMMNASGDLNSFIHITKFPTENKDINTYLEKYKSTLEKRKDWKEWFEWVNDDNVKVMQTRVGSACIYIRKDTKLSKIAFKGYVNYFDKNLIMLLPKNKKISIKDTVYHFNSPRFISNFRMGDRYKVDTLKFMNSLYLI